MMPSRPILKVGWERRTTSHFIDCEKASELIGPYTADTVEAIEHLSNGCSNTNYKLTLANHSPLVIRIYQRDESALTKELALYNAIRYNIPSPTILYHDSTKEHLPYPYAILNYIEGTLMRDVILQGREEDIAQCAYQAGKKLSQLYAYLFDECGFLDSNLTVKEPINYLNYAKSCLDNPFLLSIIEQTTLDHLKTIFINHAHCFELLNTPSLVHADFDPSNLIVKQDDKYELTGILDWEFCHAGHYFLDMGSFLRFDAFLPASYRTQFIEGLTDSGLHLPESSHKIAKLYDLISLLSLLERSGLKSSMAMVKDVVDLIKNTLRMLEM